MISTADLLERAKAAAGNVTDYRIAKILGLTPNAVGEWRRKGKTPSNPIAMRLAELAGIDPIEAMIAVNLERASTPEDREVWERLLARVSAPAPFKTGH